MRIGNFYPDGWWRDPKNAVTTDATIVEVGRTRNAGYSGYRQKVVADLKDPKTGQVVRAKASGLVTDAQGFQVGQAIRIRWSARHKDFMPWDSSTAPKDEWFGGAGIPGMPAAAGMVSTGGVQIINASGADPAAMQAKLEKLRGLGLLSDAELAQVREQLGAAGSSPSSAQPSAAGTSVESLEERLSKLKRLRAEGVLDQQEYDKQRQRILDSL